LFPAMFEGPLTESILKKGREKGLFVINIRNLRDKTIDKHKTADDASFGGGVGMVMKIEPVTAFIKELKTPKTRTILMAPTGAKLTQDKVKQLSKEEHLIVICGHYEGVDERIKDSIDEELSIGDYVLTGGEIPAMVLIDSVCRYIPGVVKEMDSVEGDSFGNGLLDFPHYTRPAEYEGQKVPDVLQNGNHEDIRRWRRKESLKKTLSVRPDLLPKAELGKEDLELIEEIVLGL
ncbi:MAG: tRNA (guanosine(37)-N1)-methyltransferase TrmD, partial [Candidatus Margulisiibacteriota bacterium]